MATAYEGYQPLDEPEQEIRLITLHAAVVSGQDEGEAIVACTLENVALRHANPFYALSYVWGPSTPIHPMTVNGQTVHIRRNLWLFLLALRERFCRKTGKEPSGQGSIRVWADYVCIQQSDVRERNFQVAMMGDIYKTADAIYAWLGESQTPVDDGMRCIAETAALRKQRVSWAQIRRNVGNIEERVRGISTSQYWSRMWIKQEALLAKDLWFFFGPDVVHWQDMSVAVQLCPAHPGRQSQATSCRAMLSLFRARERGRVQYELHDLVERFADATCQDPRDRIYALLALIDRKTSRQIVVDYRKPVLQVLVENYAHWAVNESSRPYTDKSVTDASAYNVGYFCKAVHKVLPSADLEVLCNSECARQEITSEAVFTATDISSLEWVCPIATIDRTTVAAVSCTHEVEDDRRAFILRVSLRPYRSHQGTRSRQCFIYANVVPEVDTRVVWLGSRVLFFRLSDDQQAEAASRPSLQGTGTEVRETVRRADDGGGGQLSRQFLPHPCRWLTGQFDDARFAIRVAGSSLRHDNVRVTCNAAAMLLLLRESKTDHTASTHGKDTSSSASSPVAEAEHSRLWSPYAFGIEQKLLQPCQLCRKTGRNAALSKKPEAAAEAWVPCDCKWIGRVEC